MHGRIVDMVRLIKKSNPLNTYLHWWTQSLHFLYPSRQDVLDPLTSAGGGALQSTELTERAKGLPDTLRGVPIDVAGQSD